MFPTRSCLASIKITFVSGPPIVMNANRWDAGQKLMRKTDPASWNRMVADWTLLTDNKINAKAIAACESEAAKLHKAQDCRITVPAGK